MPAVLVDALVEGRSRGRLPGATRTAGVRTHPQEQHRDPAGDGRVQHLFSNDVTALSLVRNLGLGTAARLGLAPRHAFGKVALGRARPADALSATRFALSLADLPSGLRLADSPSRRQPVRPSWRFLCPRVV